MDNAVGRLYVQEAFSEKSKELVSREWIRLCSARQNTITNIKTNLLTLLDSVQFVPDITEFHVFFFLFIKTCDLCSIITILPGMCFHKNNVQVFMHLYIIRTYSTRTCV